VLLELGWDSAQVGARVVAAIVAWLKTVCAAQLTLPVLPPSSKQSTQVVLTGACEADKGRTNRPEEAAAHPLVLLSVHTSPSATLPDLIGSDLT
jgi:hypothetical protein